MERLSMERWIRHANIANFRRQIGSPANENQRGILVTLLAEEQAEEVAANLLAEIATYPDELGRGLFFFSLGVGSASVLAVDPPGLP